IGKTAVQAPYQMAGQHRRGMTARSMANRDIRSKIKFRERLFEQVALLARGDDSYLRPRCLAEPADDRSYLDDLGPSTDDKSKGPNGHSLLEVLSAMVMH